MLNPNDDRLYYGSILSPPENYQLEFAIGTTYSLDLDALVGASISLGLSDDIDSNLMDNPIFLLEALRKTSEKVIIFCENGQIKLPTNPTELYILLENMVFQIKTSKKIQQNRYASFHPKFWLLKYNDEGDNFFYRLIVLSRNLTFDRSWDISFTMDGYKKDESTNKNDAIINLLDYLDDFSNDEIKSGKIHAIIDELPFIEFDLKSRTFKDFDFYLNGINDEQVIQNSQLFENESLDRLMIVTPFLSNDIVKNFNNRINNYQAMLFTRLNSLESLNPKDCDNFEVYTLKDEIIDGESIVSEEAQEILKQDIHAKIYAVENGKFTDIYLGSLNASHNALYGNIEFMIKLQARKKKINIEQLANDLFNGEKGGPKDPFELRNVADYKCDESSEGKDLDLIIKYISRLKSNAMVIEEDMFYNLEVRFEDLDKNEFEFDELLIKPLLSNKTRDLVSFNKFENLDKLSLSEFYVVTVKADNEILSKVIKIPTRGLPEDRQKEVISSIITDENAFIQYVAFLLGDDFILSIENNQIGDTINTRSIQLPELYEKMLKATIYSPEKFKDLEFLIDALSEDNVIPEGFEEMYNTFLEGLD